MPNVIHIDTDPLSIAQSRRFATQVGRDEVLIVGAHGDADNFFDQHFNLVSPEALAAFVTRRPNFSSIKAIWLLSCMSGAGSAAEAFLRELHRRRPRQKISVIAANGVMRVKDQLPRENRYANFQSTVRVTTLESHLKDGGSDDTAVDVEDNHSFRLLEMQGDQVVSRPLPGSVLLHFFNTPHGGRNPPKRDPTHPMCLVLSALLQPEW